MKPDEAPTEPHEPPPRRPSTLVVLLRVARWWKRIPKLLRKVLGLFLAAGAGTLVGLYCAKLPEALQPACRAAAKILTAGASFF